MVLSSLGRNYDNTYSIYRRRFDKRCHDEPTLEAIENGVCSKANATAESDWFAAQQRLQGCQFHVAQSGTCRQH